MPIFRYFIFVGGALLALLFAVDFALPKAPAEQAALTTAGDLPLIRIRSDRKLPERVVLDTNQPLVAPPAAQTAAVAAPQPTATAESSSPALNDPSAKTRGRESFAQLVPATPKAEAAAVRKAEAKPSRRKIARTRPNPYPYAYPYGAPGKPMLMAQQPHFGPFNMTW